MTQQYNAVYKKTYPVESGRSKSPSLVESILFVINIFYSQLYMNIGFSNMLCQYKLSPFTCTKRTFSNSNKFFYSKAILLIEI